MRQFENNVISLFLPNWHTAEITLADTRRIIYLVLLKIMTLAAPSSWNKYIPDIILLLLYFFCLNPLMQWQQQHLSLSCTLLMLLNIAAVGLGCYSFFTAFANMEILAKYRNTLSAFESAALGLSAFTSCLAFCWWLVPFAAVKTMGVQETGFIFGAVLYFIMFIAVVANSIIVKEKSNSSTAAWLPLLSTIVTIAFFFFSYAFLLVTLPHWNPSFAGAPYLAIACMFIFYLPLRFFLLLRPPFHRSEYVVFIISFGVLMYTLFVRLQGV